MSRLGSKSGIEGTKNWKSLKGGLQGFQTRISEMEKIKDYDAKKTFENWFMVSESKLNVSQYDLKWPSQLDPFNGSYQNVECQVTDNDHK